MGRPGPGPGDPGPAASFVVPGDPKAAPGSPAYEYGSQVANLKNLSVVGILTKILMQIQNRHGHHIMLSDSTYLHSKGSRSSRPAVEGEVH